MQHVIPLSKILQELQFPDMPKYCYVFFLYAKILICQYPGEPGSQRYKCPECGKCFKYASQFDYHYGLHHSYSNEKKCSCDMCDFQTYTSLQLIRQKRRHHNKHEEVCEKCGKKCKSRHALNKHIASVHTVHKCPSCSEGFSTSAKMRKHSNEVHGIDIPWNMLCSKCPRSFPNRELSKHILSKHPD